MIGSLKGTVARLGENTAVIEVAGVGYLVQAGARTLEKLSVGEAAALSIETAVREDYIRLYGFHEETERLAFVTLQSVQGVGAKHAFAILDVLSPSDLFDAITHGDIAAVTRAHGVGKKLAERIMTELKGKAGAFVAPMGAAALKLAANGAAAAPVDAGASARADAASALVNLGYDGVDARRAVAAVAGGGAVADVGALVTAALKELAL